MWSDWVNREIKNIEIINFYQSLFIDSLVDGSVLTQGLLIQLIDLSCMQEEIVVISQECKQLISDEQ